VVAAAGLVARAVRSGKGLQEIAVVLADALDDPNTEPSALAGIARELRLTLAAVEASGTQTKGDKLDDLAARRKARLKSG
jgi:hypothetical protein